MMQVFYIFGTSNELAIDDVRLILIDERLHTSLHTKIREPSHLKWKGDAHDMSIRKKRRLGDKGKTCSALTYGDNASFCWFVNDDELRQQRVMSCSWLSDLM